jgi:ElaB/YqjD/DUF883 family membrane-anchored ribosome-binding protein
MNTMTTPDPRTTRKPSQAQTAGPIVEENHPSAASRKPGDKAASKGAKDRPSETMDTVSDRVTDAAESARRTVEDGYRQAADTAGAAYETAADSMDRGYQYARDNAEYAARYANIQGRRAGAEVSRFVSDNPLMVGVIGFAGGLLLGALIPWSKRNGGSDDRYGPRYGEAYGEHHRGSHSGSHRPYPFSDDRPGDYR